MPYNIYNQGKGTMIQYHVLTVILGYLLGSLPMGYLIGKLYGVDAVSYTHLTLPTKA